MAVKKDDAPTNVQAEAKPDAATTEAPVAPQSNDPSVAERIGTATNDPSASETLPEGTTVDPTSGPQGAPSPLAGGTGYHCGYCGQVIGVNGEHYNADGSAAVVPHPATMVLADSGPQVKGEDDLPAKSGQYETDTTSERPGQAKDTEAKPANASTGK